MKIVDMARRAIDAANDALFPASCVHCGTQGKFLCEPCTRASTRLEPRAICRTCALPWHAGARCGRCASDPPPVSSLLAVYAFDGPIRSAVHALKYEGLRAVAPVLGNAMANLYGNRRRTPDAIIPVPLHRSRLRNRGYNQAELLARPLARRIGAPLLAGLLQRVGDARPQAEAPNETERAARVRDAFRCPASVEGMYILLVDDVATTGSTVNSAARALLDAGAWGVSAIVLAREL